jgi:hypothetical protein
MQKDTDKKNEKDFFLTCEKCFHQNEKERVYCHNCGEKLDRSVLPKPEEEKEYEKPEETQKRVKKLMDPHRGWLRRDAKIFLQVVVFAAVVATFFLFWQSPDFVPPLKPDELPLRYANDEWRDAMAVRAPRRVTLTDAQINYDLARMIKIGESSIPGFKFDRPFVHCEPGIITITAQYSMWDMPMYCSISYHPAVKNGVFSAEVIGVHFGRLGVDPKAKAVGELALGAVFKAFDEDAKQFSRLAEVTVDEGTITFTTKPLP